jgi:hypothetical protein
MRESALQFLVQKNHDGLFNLLKDDTIFNELIQDSIFTRIFFENFDDLFNSENSEINIAILYTFHKSKNYAFSLPNYEYEKVLKFLIDKTKKYEYAKLLPDYEISKVIIKDYQKEIKEKAEEDYKKIQKEKELEIVKLFSNNISITKSIFNSPQEQEFYLACKQVFDNEIILPNVSLTTIFNSEIVKEKYPNHFRYFLMASVDFIIVDPDTFIPFLFFELDSKTFHSTTSSIENDNNKNFLFEEFGKALIRITKNTNDQGKSDFISFLRDEKSKYENRNIH